MLKDPTKLASEIWANSGHQINEAYAILGMWLKQYAYSMPNIYIRDVVAQCNEMFMADENIGSVAP